MENIFLLELNNDMKPTSFCDVGFLLYFFRHLIVYYIIPLYWLTIWGKLGQSRRLGGERTLWILVGFFRKFFFFLFWWVLGGGRTGGQSLRKVLENTAILIFERKTLNIFRNFLGVFFVAFMMRESCESVVKSVLLKWVFIRFFWIVGLTYLEVGKSCFDFLVG